MDVAEVPAGVSAAQDGESRLWRWLTAPPCLAAIITIANAAKPILIDDAAYLAFARHLAAAPLDPYGFTIFWDTSPEPAFYTLAPPGLLYWLALGIRLFGERPVLLKLWLFPILWLLAWAVKALVDRFAGRHARLLPVVVLLSPAILSTVNVMLDVPALALALAAVTVLVRAGERDSWRLAAGAGLLAGLAMQTKYTALGLPFIFAWYGVSHRRLRLAALAVAVAVALFVGWEIFVKLSYGHSQFLFHTTYGARPGPLFWRKLRLASPLLSHLGCLGAGVGLIAAGALGVRPRWLIVGAGAWALGLMLVGFGPHGSVPVSSGQVLAIKVFWRGFGLLVLGAIGGCAALAVGAAPNRPPWKGASAFLVGWLVIEVGFYFLITPFCAARRVIGLVMIGGLLTAHVLDRVCRRYPGRQPRPWMIGFAVASGLAVAAIDTADAFSEKMVVERAAAITAQAANGRQVWCSGHWGFHYYCEHAGMRPVVPGSSQLAPGDLMVAPTTPTSGGGSIGPAVSGRKIAEVVWDSPLAGQTFMGFYGGSDPITRRDRPRLGAAVYRIDR
jgi:hypothetical protein